MIGYIKGTLAYVAPNSIVVDNHGIGYNINVPATLLQRLPSAGEEVMVYTYTYVREDAIGLFGFSSPDELEVFRLLITVSGIGPKGGLAILSTMNTDELRYAVLMDDAKAIAKSPGIGAKTAGKLILELKDKLDVKNAIFEGLAGAAEGEGVQAANSSYTVAMDDAVQALEALGYSSKEARSAVMSVPDAAEQTVEELLKLSLKYI